MSPRTEELAHGVLFTRAVFSEAECARLIALSEERGYEPATVAFATGARLATGIRNNYRLTIEDPSLTAQLWSTLEAVLPPTSPESWPLSSLNPRIRFYRYKAQQRFNRHRDGHVELEGERSRYSLLVYLNEGFVGGATQFDGVTVVPETGAVLAFLHELHHIGTSVSEGRKYVMRTDVMYRVPGAQPG